MSVADSVEQTLARARDLGAMWDAANAAGDLPAMDAVMAELRANTRAMRDLVENHPIG